MVLHPHEDTGGAAGFSSWSWPKALGFALLSFNSAIAIYRSNGDMAAVAFVVFSYIALPMLFYCLQQYERAPLGSPTRERLMVAICCLTTLLTAMSSYKIGGVVMRLPVQICMWSMVSVVILLMIRARGFYSFFSHRGSETDAVAASFRDGSRVRLRITLDYVLAALRLQLSPRREAVIAHDPRDLAWSVVRLILDSGASTHAVGNIWLLEGFQPYNPPLSATLADGRNLRILGIGRIERGDFSIRNVQLVEGLQDGLISVRQLDREHGLISCFGNGICRIMLADGTEVGGAFVQDDDGLYVLRYLEVPGPSEE